MQNNAQLTQRPEVIPGAPRAPYRTAAAQLFKQRLALMRPGRLLAELGKTIGRSLGYAAGRLSVVADQQARHLRPANQPASVRQRYDVHRGLRPAGYQDLQSRSDWIHNVRQAQ